MNTTEKELHHMANSLDSIYKELRRYNNNCETTTIPTTDDSDTIIKDNVEETNTTTDKPIEYNGVLSEIGYEAMYAQLAEEAAELAQAALKMVRIYHGTNPTPVKLGEAMNMIKEEYTDVVHCATYLDVQVDYEQLKKKDARWINRITNR